MENQDIRCEYCKKNGSNLKICGSCRQVQYCSKLCQTSDWKNHKHQCQINLSKERLRKEREARIAAEHTESSLAGIFSLLGNLRRFHDQHCKEKENSEENESEGNTLHKMRKEDHDKNNGNDSLKSKTEEKINRLQNEVKDISGSEISDDDSKIKRPDWENVSEGNETKKHICALCSSKESYKKCSKCMRIYYCSRDCQKQDWKTHRTYCRKFLENEEEKRHVDQNATEPSASQQKLFKIDGIRPKGSLRKAIEMATRLFPSYNIMTNFVYVPSQSLFNFFPSTSSPKEMTVLVAYMYKYHENVTRHAIHLKDDMENDSKVEFYLDAEDNFNYSQVKPGCYIYIKNAEKHLFRDGSVGFRIDNPEQVKILDIETIMSQRK